MEWLEKKNEEWGGSKRTVRRRTKKEFEGRGENKTIFTLGLRWACRRRGIGTRREES